MKKKILSVVLGTGLFCAVAVVHAAQYDISGTLSDLRDVSIREFVVNNSLDSTGVVLISNSYWEEEYNGVLEKRFDPFLAVWNAQGELLGRSNNSPDNNGVVELNLGRLADGVYYFGVGNWPNLPLGSYDQGFLLDNEQDLKGFMLAQGSNQDFVDRWVDNYSVDARWVVNISGVTAVPEPETWAMLLAGLGMVGAVARRRKQS